MRPHTVSELSSKAMTCVRIRQSRSHRLALHCRTGVDARGKGGYARELTAEEKTKVAGVLTKHIQQSDLIITTAAIPGKASPKLISKEQVKGMKPGAVIIDLSAEGGGNCEDTEPGKTTQIGDITIVAPLNVPSLLAQDASELYAHNQYNLLVLMLKDNIIKIDWADEYSLRPHLLTMERCAKPLKNSPESLPPKPSIEQPNRPREQPEIGRSKCTFRLLSPVL